VKCGKKDAIIQGLRERDSGKDKAEFTEMSWSCISVCNQPAEDNFISTGGGR
jgi:hypothetical protein